MSDLREQLVEMGRDAMGRNDGWRWWAPRHLIRLLDVWEPIIRADERERSEQEIDGYVIAAARIKAEVRERIAQEIEAEILNASGRSEQAIAYADALEHAARIARGGSQ